MKKHTLILIVFALFFLSDVHLCKSGNYEIKYKEDNPYHTKRGVSIPSIQSGKCYFKVFLDEGEKVWVQIVKYTSSGLGVEIKNFEYEGSGKVDAWKISLSHSTQKIEIMLWKEKYNYGEGPDPKNKEADELLTSHYFLGLVDGCYAYVK